MATRFTGWIKSELEAPPLLPAEDTAERAASANPGKGL